MTSLELFVALALTYSLGHWVGYMLGYNAGITDKGRKK